MISRAKPGTSFGANAGLSDQARKTASGPACLVAPSKQTYDKKGLLPKLRQTDEQIMALDDPWESEARDGPAQSSSFFVGTRERSATQ